MKPSAFAEIVHISPHHLNLYENGLPIPDDERIRIESTVSRAAAQHRVEQLVEQYRRRLEGNILFSDKGYRKGDVRMVRSARKAAAAFLEKHCHA